MTKQGQFAGAVGEGGDFQSAFEAITYGAMTRMEKRLAPAAAAPSIPARSGSSLPVARTSGSAGGGIASPLTELTYADRTFYASRVTETPDGLFSLSWSPLKTMRLYDANGAEVLFDFKDPLA